MRLILALVLGVVLGSPSSAQEVEFDPPADMVLPQSIEDPESNPDYFKINPESVRFLRLKIDPAQVQLPKPPGGSGPGPSTPGSGEDPIVIIDRIVNLAKKVWDIVKENQPVVDINTTYADALPSGITHWDQVEKWEPTVGTVYGFYAENLYGTRVIDVRYQVIRNYGGSYKGKGKYLHRVTIVPLRVDTAWGYTFNFNAKVPSVANVGTSEDPVASMVAQLEWHIHTILKHSHGTSVYYLEGDGTFKQIGGPFQNASREAARASLKKLAEELPSAPGI